MTRVSRRSVLAGCGTAALLLAGCGSTPGAAPPTPTSGGGFPVTLPGTPGGTTVPARPTRVVTAGYLRDTDLAIALGAPVVGAVRNVNFPGGLAPWQVFADPAPPLLAGSPGTPYEAIAALHPDLIMAADDYRIADDAAPLSAIAPTLGPLHGIGRDTWQDMTERAGLALGKPEEARRLVEATRKKIADVRAAHPRLEGRSYAFGPVQAVDQIYVSNSGTDATGEFFTQLGMHVAPAAAALPNATTPGRAKVPLERIGALDADVLILTYTGTGVRQALEANPLFQRLPVVQRGSYVVLDLPTALAIGFPSILSLPYALDRAVRAIAEKVTP